jgi:hypothetical protein
LRFDCVLIATSINLLAGNITKYDPLIAALIAPDGP